ncbi:hypothetical protein RR46_01349 [Papilio xuthus]|uniref:CHK kinase-like domain-containing protein n=1 Tax=Papilio xuthus TaxID=66420 RepID=A0A0N1I2U1_PAPXU|nr:hypothetical protein RR46_01349 [Papilio xuthus]
MADDAEKLMYCKLESVAKEQGYANYKTNVRELNTGGANYTSRLYYVTLSAPGCPDLNLFAKIAVLSEKMRSKFPIEIYTNEILYYSHILKRYQEFEEKYCINTKHRLRSIKCYGYSNEYLKESLILEDLTPKGFTTLDRFLCVDWKYASRAVSELAKFHSLSVEFRLNFPEEFEKYKERFPLLFNEHFLKDFFDNHASKTYAAIKQENRQRLVDFIKAQNFNFSKITTRCPVLAHGDFRHSNIMHKEIDNGELELIIVDYQGFQISSPLIDLMYFIILSTDKEFRSQHYHQLLDHYYSEFCGSLKRLNIDPDTVYTKDDFQHDIKLFEPYVVIMGTLILPGMSAFVENAQNMENTEDRNVFEIEPCQIGSQRLNDLIDDFVELGVL